MITIPQLREIALFKGLGLRYAEKDYLNDICLKDISRYRKALVFKGGTALYKFYKLNRFSEDLDFVINKRKFDYESVRARLVRTFGLMDIEVANGELEIHQRGGTLILLVKGPLFNGSREMLARVPIDFSSRERPRAYRILEHRPIYKDIPAFELCVMETEEIFAEKVRAIMTRNKPRDVFDVWFLLKSGTEIEVQLVKRKLKLYDEAFSLREFISAVEEKRGHWESDLQDKVIGRLPKFDMVAGELGEILKKGFT